jgi:hypothetical protein
MKSWIRICIETNTDPQHCFNVSNMYMIKSVKDPTGFPLTCIGHGRLHDTARLADSVHADDEVGEVVEAVEHAEHVHPRLHR